MATAAGPTEPAEPARVENQRINLPLRLSLIYLGGTFGLFLLVGQVGQVPDPLKLSAFVGSTMVALAVGYRARARRYLRTGQLPAPSLPSRHERSTRRWVVASGLYYLAYGASLLLAYGFDDPADLLQAISSPGQAYLSKFQVYDQQLASGEANTMIQLLTLLAVLSTPLVPFLVAYWQRLGWGVRLIGLTGVATYASFFLFIGTLKGLGDLLVFAIAAVAVRSFGPSSTRRVGGRRRRGAVVAATVVLGALFVGYMAYNQSQRIQEAGVASRFEANPVVAAVTGEELARGVAVVAFYPTHGYLGLAHNLETSFTWTAGKGSARALDSYWAQYVDGQSAFEETYPARTEARMGWPALQFWSTAYPWFASDLTFPGTVLLMGVVGWFMCQVWVQAAFGGDRLALLLFAQAALFVLYIPANNQIGTSRASLIAFTCLAILYAWRSLTSVRSAR